MINIKKPEEIEILREGGRRLAHIIKEVAKSVVPGVKTIDLDRQAYELAKEGGDEPAFLNYRPDGVRQPYPASLCVSINNEIVHGIPSEEIILKQGDIVSIDMGLKHKGLITDHAVTLPVGKVSKEAQELLWKTEEALYAAIEAAKLGGHVGDIGAAVEKLARKYGYGIPKELAGHGVGYEVHEDPYIPNRGKEGEGEELVSGFVFAIEPMFTLGRQEVEFDSDEYTVRTKDGNLSAHFEHTVAVTEDGVEILTKE